MLIRQTQIISKATELQYKTLEGYRLLLRENARALWAGEWEFFGFYEGMMSTINRGFRQAWEEGMQKYNLKITDQNEEERTRMLQEINAETMHIEGVADFIDTHSKANGGKLSSCLQRMEQWAAAYTRIKQLATAMAAKDQPLEWAIDAPKESCDSCLRLNGKVKRASYWVAHGVIPKAWDKLDCRNGCKCSLKPTNKPLSKGPLPKLP